MKKGCEYLKQHAPGLKSQHGNKLTVVERNQSATHYFLLYMLNRNERGVIFCEMKVLTEIGVRDRFSPFAIDGVQIHGAFPFEGKPK